jgi:hypothetical protein
MAQDNPFSLKFLFAQTQPAPAPTTIQQATGVNPEQFKSGLSNFANTKGFAAKAKALWGGLKSTVDSNGDGKPDLQGGVNRLLSPTGVPGMVASAVSNIQAPVAPQPQPVPQTPYSSLMNGFSLDTFLKGIPQIGTNFYNTPEYSSSGLPQAPQYGLPDTSNNSWYTGTGAGSMGPVPPAPQDPAQGAPVVQPRVPVQSMPVSNWQSTPQMGLADYNSLAMRSEAANMVNDPSARNMKDTSVASRFDPLAGHNAFVQRMDMAKYAGELNPGKALEDAKFAEEMARKLGNMAQ